MNPACPYPVRPGSKKEGLLLAFAGCSMEPTLGELDLLEVEACGDRAIVTGDVIVFADPGDGKLVAHRVIETRGSTLTTRGDASNSPDPWVLSVDEVHGRVVAAHRGSRRRSIPGGARGRLRIRLLGFARSLRRLVAAPCRALMAGDPLRRLISALLPGRARPRIIATRNAGKLQLSLATGSRLLGRYDRHRGRWQVTRLGRLLIEPDTLPSPEQLTG